MVLNAKTSLLIILSGALLISGSALVLNKIQLPSVTREEPSLTDSSSITVALLQGQTSDLQGAFEVDSADNLLIQRNGKDAFSFLLAHYKDGQQRERKALLYPPSQDDSTAFLSATAIRQSLWRDAAPAIKRHLPQNAVMLSWWDDGQRIHFLSGREPWIGEPADPTFASPVWKELADYLPRADETGKQRLKKLAHWLTMDASQALQQIRQTFGTEQPVYLLVTNDLLLRLGELSNYGAQALTLESSAFPAQSNLHGDITKIRQWAGETGNGNYLVQKEGGGYRVWTTPKDSGTAKGTLLVRLLPFVDSLKQLPDRVQLVYQSHWGGYLSIYRLN